MHEPLLAQAALPAPTVVLGMLLRPYSLGHELYLIREGNPLAIGSPFATRQDLAAAVLICCQSWDEAKIMPSDWLIGIKLRIWNWRTRKLDTQRELEAFLAYQQAGLLEFKLSDIAHADRATPRTPGTPFLLRLNQWLIRNLNLTESQAWDYPYGLATMRWAAHWEQEGGLDVYNADDAVFDNYIAEQEAKGAERCPV